MSGYSYPVLEALWIGVGGAPSQASMAAAIALAESRGQNIPNSTGAPSYGLWQINTNAHPEYTPTQMLNPINNAKAAVAVSQNGTNWNPWQTYTDGSYQSFLQSNVTPDPSTESQVKFATSIGAGSTTNAFATKKLPSWFLSDIHKNVLNGNPPFSKADLNRIGATTSDDINALYQNPEVLKASMVSGTQTIINPTSPDITSGANAIGNAIPGLNQITSVADAIKWLFDPNHLLRGGEVILGSVLVIVLLAELTKGA